jgi:hypothetical protein
MPETSKRQRHAARNNQLYSAKDRIDHSRFGPGTILEIDENYTTIEFDDNGTRKFVTGILQVEPSDTPKPPRRRKATKKKVSRAG